MIDTEALRKKVIDLAIQGKLTEQLPSDGDAETLYAQIQEEKDKLVKEDEIKKEKPLPEITDDEIPFEIPSNWKWCRLGEVYTVLMGQSPDGMNVGVDIDGMEFHQGKIFFGEKYLQESGQKTSELTRVADENSVLLCVRAPVGVVNITKRKICIGRGLCALKAVADMGPYYLFYYLLSCRKSFEMSGTGSTFSSITVDVVKKHIIPIPPLAEQKRIVEVLDSVFNQFTVIDDLQEKYRYDLATLKSKIIDAGIRGKLTEQFPVDGDAETLYAQIQEEKAKLIKEGKIKKEKPLPDIEADEIPFEIPKNWKWVRFGNASYIIGTGLIRSGKEQFEKADCYYFKMNNMGNFDGKCDYDNMVMVNVSEDEYNRFKLQEGDFLFNTRNSVELVGKSVVINEMPYENIVYNNNILKIRFLERCIVNYVGLYFISSYGKNALKQFVSSTTNVAAIYQRQIITLPIPLPPLGEQKRIVAKVEAILELI